MYKRLKYLHSEGFYIFAVSFLKPEKKGWIEYSEEKTYDCEKTIEEEFKDITEQEYNKCKRYFDKIVKDKPI